jgi:hypothetical protein
MKSTLSLVLTMSLIVTAFPAAAQDPRESDWSRVRKLAPGSEIAIKVDGSPEARRSLLAVDSSGLTVLNVADPAIPPETRRLLRDIASNHADSLAGARHGGTFLLDDNQRIAPDGVFVRGRKVADLDVIEIIARRDIGEISKLATVNRGAAAGGAIGGALGGVFVGFRFAQYLAYSPCHGSCTKNETLMMLSLAGIPVAGGVLGYLATRHKGPVIVYRGP